MKRDLYDDDDDDAPVVVLPEDLEFGDDDEVRRWAPASLSASTGFDPRDLAVPRNAAPSLERESDRVSVRRRARLSVQQGAEALEPVCGYSWRRRGWRTGCRSAPSMLLSGALAERRRAGGGRRRTSASSTGKMKGSKTRKGGAGVTVFRDTNCHRR